MPPNPSKSYWTQMNPLVNGKRRLPYPKGFWILQNFNSVHYLRNSYTYTYSNGMQKGRLVTEHRQSQWSSHPPICMGVRCHSVSCTVCGLKNNSLCNLKASWGSFHNSMSACIHVPVGQREESWQKRKMGANPPKKFFVPSYNIHESSQALLGNNVLPSRSLNNQWQLVLMV